jgi:nucleoside-diphosphate-sugar epimerase
VLRRIPDLTKQRRILDFEPQISLEEGIRRLWAWHSQLDEREEALKSAT